MDLFVLLKMGSYQTTLLPSTLVLSPPISDLLVSSLAPSTSRTLSSPGSCIHGFDILVIYLRLNMITCFCLNMTRCLTACKKYIYIYRIMVYFLFGSLIDLSHRSIVLSCVLIGILLLISKWLCVIDCLL